MLLLRALEFFRVKLCGGNMNRNYTSAFRSSRFISRCVLGLFLFSLRTVFLNSSALANEIPRLQVDLDFRHTVENALDLQEPTFTFHRNGVSQKYLVSYGKGYLFAHAIRLNAFQQLLPEIVKHKAGGGGSLDGLRQIEDAAKAIEGSKFKKFLEEKAIYSEQPSMNDHVNRYSVYIPMPGHPAEKLGPYFSFTLTLLNADPNVSIPPNYYQVVARLLHGLIEEEVHHCPELMSIRNGMDQATFERDTTPDLTADEKQRLELTLNQLSWTEQMLLATKIIPNLSTEARVDYIQKKIPTFPRELVLTILKELNEGAVQGAQSGGSR